MNYETEQNVATQSSPFHPGERAVQTRAGVREEAEKRGQRMLTPDLNKQQVDFFAQLPFLISAHTDEHGQPWAGLITGAPGFIHLDESNRQFSLDWTRAANPTAVAARAGSNIGLLGIDLQTRRRNRLNGTVFATHEQQWRILIDQGYGNCPKYINERAWPGALFEDHYTATETQGLTAEARALATQADTFFIATSSGPGNDDNATRPSAWGADASHRGGEPGFLDCKDGKLEFEDFPGNNMFNTLGNIAQYPDCGLLILNFDNGDFVQLAAQATIQETATSRIIHLDIESTRHWSPSRELH